MPLEKISLLKFRISEAPQRRLCICFGDSAEAQVVTYQSFKLLHVREYLQLPSFLRAFFANKCFLKIDFLKLSFALEKPSIPTM